MIRRRDDEPPWPERCWLRVARSSCTISISPSSSTAGSCCCVISEVGLWSCRSVCVGAWSQIEGTCVMIWRINASNSNSNSSERSPPNNVCSWSLQVAVVAGSRRWTGWRAVAAVEGGSTGVMLSAFCQRNKQQAAREKARRVAVYGVSGRAPKVKASIPCRDFVCEDKRFSRAGAWIHSFCAGASVGAGGVHGSPHLLQRVDPRFLPRALELPPLKRHLDPLPPSWAAELAPIAADIAPSVPSFPRFRRMKALQQNITAPLLSYTSPRINSYTPLPRPCSIHDRQRQGHYRHQNGPPRIIETPHLKWRCLRSGS